MISGFNTDIEFEGTVYHVQTEDKGVSSRLIVSLVYDGGTILASKRESYDDLAAANFDEKELSERVGRQHKLICAAVRAGRIAELKGMSGKPAAAASKKKKPKTVVVAVEPAVVAPETVIVAAEPMPAVMQEPHGSSSMLGPVPPPFVPRIENIPVQTPASIRIEPEDYAHLRRTLADGPVIEATEIIEDVIMPADAVAVVSELSGRERPTNAKLSIELLGDSKFRSGDRRTVNIMVCRGTERKVIKDAQIMIKVLGSGFRPVIFHARSDANGIAKVHLQLPQFQAGRAALLVRAMSDGDEIELRRVVTPG